MSGGNYDRAVADAKEGATTALLELSEGQDRHRMARALDNLNCAWDELTDALVRQRKARDDTIAYLHGKIAELEKQR